MSNVLRHVGNIPLTGFGWNSFNLQYSQWQSEYFKSHPDPGIYSVLADCPLFAYNEMLHYYVELGIVSPLFFSFFGLFISAG